MGAPRANKPNGANSTGHPGAAPRVRARLPQAQAAPPADAMAVPATVVLDSRPQPEPANPSSLIASSNMDISASGDLGAPDVAPQMTRKRTAPPAGVFGSSVPINFVFGARPPTATADSGVVNPQRANGNGNRTLSSLIADKLLEGFELLPESCPVTRVPLVQNQHGHVFSVGTGQWFERAQDGRIWQIEPSSRVAPVVDLTKPPEPGRASGGDAVAPIPPNSRGATVAEPPTHPKPGRAIGGAVDAPISSSPLMAPECAQVLPRLARAVQEQRDAESVIRERFPGLSADQVFEGRPAIIARNLARLTIDTAKSINPLHQDARASTVMFITPVTSWTEKHAQNPFSMPMKVKTAAACKLRDDLVDLLSKVDYGFLTKDGEPGKTTFLDVFEDGRKSIDIHFDDGQITGLYTLTVFSEFALQLACAFRKGHFGYFFCPGLPRDEPAGTLYTSIAVDKYRGKTHIRQDEVIFELWHQHRSTSIYSITDTRAFKGLNVFMCTCVNEQHVDWALRNPVTLLGDEQYDAFRHEPVKGVNIFFISNVQSVTDFNLRIKPGLAGLLHCLASEVSAYKVTDIISRNVVVLRVETPDDAATVAQVSALMSRGMILSTTKPGNPTITYATSHVGTPYKLASSLDELQKLVGHTIVRSTSSAEPELGEEPDIIRAAPGAETCAAAELDAILAAAPPASPGTQRTRRHRVAPLGPPQALVTPATGGSPQPLHTRLVPAEQPPSVLPSTHASLAPALANVVTPFAPAQGSAGSDGISPAVLASATARPATAGNANPPRAVVGTDPSYSTLVADKLRVGFELLRDGKGHLVCCPVTHVPLVRNRSGHILSVVTGHWFELIDGGLREHDTTWQPAALMRRS